MSPTPVDTSRKRKFSENNESVEPTLNGSVVKKSRLSTAKESIWGFFSWVSHGARKAISKESLVQPISYVNKVWDELSQSFGQNEYQGPELEGPELITSVPTIVPMSNVSLTASSGMPSSNLATNTTFINLAPQPSLPPFAVPSSMHAGNTNLNHPLQSLHAMHPGGGGDVLNPEISSQEAAAMVAAAAQHQCLQLSLGRSTNTAGKYARGNNGFAPGGFSTPVMSVTAPQSRLGNRQAFAFNMSGAQNVSSLQFKGKTQERSPIRIKKTASANTTHEKLFSNRPVTTLRPPRADSPSVPTVFRHLLRKVRRKPNACQAAIDLEEKEKYTRLLRASGVKVPFGASHGSTSSVSSRERPRSRASSITVGSRYSDSSHSPPISALPNGVSWKPLTSAGSSLKPIVLGGSDDEENVVKKSPEIVLDDEETTASAPNGIVEVTLDDTAEDEPQVEKTPSPETVKADIPTSVAKDDGGIEEVLPSTSSSVTPKSGKAAFFVEKEVFGPKLVDLTEDAGSSVVSEQSQFVEKPRVRKISIPTEPDFVKSARQAPYADHKWLEGMKHAVTVDKNKNDISAQEQEAHLQVLRTEKDSLDRDLMIRIKNQLTLTKRIKPPVEEVFVESSEEESEEEEEEEDKDFPPLTDDMEDRINEATNPNPPMAVLSSAFKLDITRKDIRTLVGLEWLNDEIINFYMNMLVDRSEKSEGALPKVYTFNTFFYPTLIKDGYSRLKRWTRRVDLFSYDIVIIPVHLQMHWCLAVIDLANKEIRYYDSMGGNNQKCLNALKTYLVEEHMDKKKSAFNLDGWSYECVKDIPQQMNGSDCGMFTCKFAEYITRRAPINFSQEHMPYFRRRMIYEILTLQLM